LAQSANADIVITGRILRHELARNSKPNLPLVVGIPQTQAHLAADFRIVDQRDSGNVLTFSLSGMGQQSRGVRMFPTSGDDRTSYLSALDKQRVWTDAIQSMLSELFGGMRENFDWFPG
jgi:curli biogenesis system outer membrane secretion channel CsgG